MQPADTFDVCSQVSDTNASQECARKQATSLLPGVLAVALSLAGCPTGWAGTFAGEDLAAPPPVTAAAWAITDGQTGRLLWGAKADEPRKAASTTKMMCAYVILQLAAEKPQVLEEIVTFSQLADQTSGSTAGIQAGEKVSVRECLYGLLLPSGNDAGNALAEHFNGRFAAPDEKMRAFGLDNPTLATRANFISEMNRTARRLGLTNTIYRSSYGDGGSPDDRTTTVRDLTRLAWYAMQNALFRDYVSTLQYEGHLQTPDGGTRRVLWKNTNELLSLKAGYDGIKTGTTTQAGACLVSSGRRGDDHLIVAVLGSESGNGRFVDTRNLFRWAWQQRMHR